MGLKVDKFNHPSETFDDMAESGYQSTINQSMSQRLGSIRDSATISFNAELFQGLFSRRDASTA